MGASGGFVRRLRRAPASRGSAGGVFSRPDGGGRHHGGQRGIDPGPSRALHWRAGDHGGLHRERDHAFDPSLLLSGMAHHSRRRFCDHRRQQLSGLDHEPLARHAGHDQRLGLIAGGRRRNGHHGCGIWRGRPARRLHAVFPRRLRCGPCLCDRRGLDAYDRGSSSSNGMVSRGPLESLCGRRFSLRAYAQRPGGFSAFPRGRC